MIVFPSDELGKIKKLLSVPQKIVITTHHRPDGDAMGSSLGLYNYLKLKGHSVTVITPGEYPDFLAWLPGNKTVIDFEKKTSEAKKEIQSAAVIFCLDFNWLSRLEKMENDVRTCDAVKVLIDHHLEPE